MRDITIAGAKVQLDSRCKNILSVRIILAWIMKGTMKEFSGLSIEKIMQCIEGEPEISTVKVHPGETNALPSDSTTDTDSQKTYTTEKIIGTNTENTIPDEGTIYYDIRFFACIPQELSSNRQRVKIILNLEAQKSFYPGYDIVTRGIFYGCRMISAQLDTEFKIPDYNGLKKVYSVWICMNAPKYIGNAISRYPIEKEDLVAGIPDKPEAYDKITVALVCLNEEMPKANAFLEMLNVLLSTTLSAQEKKQILSGRFRINVDRQLEKEVNLMCNYSEYVEERGAYGKLKELVQKKLQKGQTIEKIADALEESIEMVQQIIDELSAEKAP